MNAFTLGPVMKDVHTLGEGGGKNNLMLLSQNVLTICAYKIQPKRRVKQDLDMQKFCGCHS